MYGVMCSLLVTAVISAYLCLCVPGAFTNLDEQSAYVCSKPFSVCCIYMTMNESMYSNIVTNYCFKWAARLYSLKYAMD